MVLGGSSEFGECQFQCLKYVLECGPGVFPSSQLGIDGTGYDMVVLNREEKGRHRVKQKR
jgi:hypothetical protein